MLHELKAAVPGQLFTKSEVAVHSSQHLSHVYESWQTPESKVRVRSRSLDPIDSIGWFLSITVGLNPPAKGIENRLMMGVLKRTISDHVVDALCCPRPARPWCLVNEPNPAKLPGRSSVRWRTDAHGP